MQIHSDSHRHHLICLEKKEKGHKQNTYKGLGESKYKMQKKRRKRERERIGGFELNSNYVLSVNLIVKVKE